jgi:hypothetical protein
VSVDPFQSVLLPVPQAESLVDEFRRDGDWSREHGVAAHMTLAGPWALTVTVPRAALAALVSDLRGFRYELAQVGRLGDATCLFPDEAASLLPWRERLLDLVGVPDGVDGNWRIHLTVCRKLDSAQAAAVEDALARLLPLECCAGDLVLATLLGPEEISIERIGPR